MRDVLEELLGPETEEEREEQDGLEDWPFALARPNPGRQERSEDGSLPLADGTERAPAPGGERSRTGAGTALPQGPEKQGGALAALERKGRSGSLPWTESRAENIGPETERTGEGVPVHTGAETERLTADALRHSLWLGGRSCTPGRARAEGPAERVYGQARTAEWLYQQLRRTRQAASYRRPVPSGPVSLAKWNGTAQARPGEEAGRLDRLFRRDARRYDGGFTWL